MKFTRKHALAWSRKGEPAPSLLASRKPADLTRLHGVVDRRIRLSPLLAADERFAFVAVGHLAAVPGARVIWLKTDSAILFSGCSHCGAVIGRPCVDKAGVPKTGTHWNRRKAATKKLGRRL